jgi:hypothetical protein
MRYLDAQHSNLQAEDIYASQVQMTSLHLDQERLCLMRACISTLYQMEIQAQRFLAGCRRRGVLAMKLWCPSMRPPREFTGGVRGSWQTIFKMLWPAGLTAGAWHRVTIQRTADGLWCAFLDGVPSKKYVIGAHNSTSVSYGSAQEGNFTDAIQFGGGAGIPLTVGLYPLEGGGWKFVGYLRDMSVVIGKSYPVSGFSV